MYGFILTPSFALVRTAFIVPPGMGVRNTNRVLDIFGLVRDSSMLFGRNLPLAELPFHSRPTPGMVISSSFRASFSMNFLQMGQHFQQLIIWSAWNLHVSNKDASLNSLMITIVKEWAEKCYGCDQTWDHSAVTREPSLSPEWFHPHQSGQIRQGPHYLICDQRPASWEQL